MGCEKCGWRVLPCHSSGVGHAECKKGFILVCRWGCRTSAVWWWRWERGIRADEQGGEAAVFGLVYIGPAVQEHPQRVDVAFLSGCFWGAGCVECDKRGVGSVKHGDIQLEVRLYVVRRMNGLLEGGVGTDEQGGGAILVGLVDTGPTVQEHRQRVDVVVQSGCYVRM